MPIKRTYGCTQCNHILEVILRADQWQDGPPTCPVCVSRETQQIFKPPALGGSPARRAADMALEIAEKDYGVADISVDRGEGVAPKVRYRSSDAPPSSWGTSFDALQSAVAIGRQTRQQYGGSGLDILQANLKSGVQPDLIELSKKRSTRVF